MGLWPNRKLWIIPDGHTPNFELFVRDIESGLGRGQLRPYDGKNRKM